MNSVKSVGAPSANPFGSPDLDERPGSGLRASPRKSTTASENDKAATQLESYFLRTIMSETRGNMDSPGSMDAGFAGGTFREMLDGALTDRMSEGQGVGLKKVIIQSLEREQKGQDEKNSSAQAVKMMTHSPVDAVLAHRALKEGG